MALKPDTSENRSEIREVFKYGAEEGWRKSLGQIM
jgi:hypothetical protein